MADIATVAALLSSIKSATDITKMIGESNLTLKQAEIKLKLSELYSALADANQQIADIKQLLIEKDQYIQDLQQQLQLRHDLCWDAPFYWIRQEREDSADGPFCQNCWDSKKKLIHLYKRPKKKGWRCKACNEIFNIATEKKRPRKIPQPE